MYLAQRLVRLSHIVYVIIDEYELYDQFNTVLSWGFFFFFFWEVMLLHFVFGMCLYLSLNPNPSSLYFNHATTTVLRMNIGFYANVEAIILRKLSILGNVVTHVNHSG